MARLKARRAILYEMLTAGELDFSIPLLSGRNDIL
jgi:hypothetical protein